MATASYNTCPTIHAGATNDLASTCRGAKLEFGKQAAQTTPAAYPYPTNPVWRARGDALHTENTLAVAKCWSQHFQKLRLVCRGSGRHHARVFGGHNHKCSRKEHRLGTGLATSRRGKKALGASPDTFTYMLEPSPRSCTQQCGCAQCDQRQCHQNERTCWRDAHTPSAATALIRAALCARGSRAKEREQRGTTRVHGAGR